jgi:hypothetical protein
MAHLGVGTSKTYEFKVPFDKGLVETLAELAALHLILLVRAEHVDAYPQPLFKNGTKCSSLGEKLLKELAQSDREKVPAAPR